MARKKLGMKVDCIETFFSLDEKRSRYYTDVVSEINLFGCRKWFGVGPEAE